MIKDDLLSRTLLLDLETTRSGRIRHIGAVFNDTVFEKQTHAHSKQTLMALDDLARRADFVLGHNLLGHDFPILQATQPELQILKKPVIDTLYLSPLAFPRNPYHRLVKDYKLVRASINDPVADARIAASIFGDQLQSFQITREKRPRDLDFFRFCFKDAIFNGFSGDGLADVFGALNGRGIASTGAVIEYFMAATVDLVCRQSIPHLLPDIIKDPARRPVLAYCLAWLQVAGSNSVLPPWVRHRFPE
ncbi:MAG: RecQ family ATP-dependent DNA helicase, partial [Holophagae bacterium]|nr:RecQ family ATP-dependent DNA helicase [Holophagae bacterium]